MKLVARWNRGYSLAYLGNFIMSCCSLYTSPPSVQQTQARGSAREDGDATPWVSYTLVHHGSKFKFKDEAQSTPKLITEPRITGVVS
jgi:hypothetical protein